MKRIEISKNNGNFFYTGKIRITENQIHIDTIKGEKLTFRLEQVQQIEEYDMGERNGRV